MAEEPESKAPKKPGANNAERRREKLAAALRANLKRRKQGSEKPENNEKPVENRRPSHE
ncbi:MAG: hypothetical protein IPL47_01190 [Phyllobacteriaceae bacterium]|nr:hypothetical protein [Phyllobacteriaceae bacterium]